jgi:alkylated DNA repair dioxygenase AlkB
MEPTNLLPHGGTVFYYPDFLTQNEADHYFKTLKEKTDWQQYTIRIFGKQVLQPRLSAWVGDKNYAYSGKSLTAAAWSTDLLELKSRLQKFLSENFNSVLLNLYRDGSDSMGWHRDNEKELGQEPVIASLSFGAEREFRLRDHQTKKEIIKITPQHGSLIVMKGQTQTNWEHGLPKTAKIKSERINLTFRHIF